MLSETFGPCHRAKMIYEAFRMDVRHTINYGIIWGSFKLALTYLTSPHWTPNGESIFKTRISDVFHLT